MGEVGETGETGTRTDGSKKGPPGEKSGEKRLNMRLTSAAHRALKRYAADHDLTLQQVADEALRDWARAHGVRLD